MYSVQLYKYMYITFENTTREVNRDNSDSTLMLPRSLSPHKQVGQLPTSWGADRLAYGRDAPNPVFQRSPQNISSISSNIVEMYGSYTRLTLMDKQPRNLPAVKIPCL